MSLGAPYSPVEADHARLRELAKAATPGPWRVSESDNGTVKGPTPTGWLSSSQVPADAAYIAALAPTTVLSLLDQIEEWRKLADYRAEVCNIYSYAIGTLKRDLERLEKVQRPEARR